MLHGAVETDDKRGGDVAFFWSHPLTPVGNLRGNLSIDSDGRMWKHTGATWVGLTDQEEEDLCKAIAGRHMAMFVVEGSGDKSYITCRKRGGITVRTYGPGRVAPLLYRANQELVYYRGGYVE